MKSLLIADSGSSKTDWVFTSETNGTLEVHTTGINPVRDSQRAILDVLTQELLPQLTYTHISTIHFYGAGCIPPYAEEVKTALKICFPESNIHVESDLLGAARALCGRSPGIACILGTGSNSGLYNGKEIVQNVSPLGYILGDEGSGAVLGRILVGNVLKNQLEAPLCHEFLLHFSLTPADIIERVYRQPQANRFLASLVPFLHLKRKHPQIHELLVEAFKQFLQRNIRQYNQPDLSVNFVGSIAYYFEEELHEALQSESMKRGVILQKPIVGITNYHKKHRFFT